MRKTAICWGLVGSLAWAFFGCHRSIVSGEITPDQIPAREYHVTVHQSYPNYFAVLFDIPDDDTEIVLIRTAFTKSMGTDRPDTYIEQFQNQIRSYKTSMISDKNGILRGYILSSTLIDHTTTDDPRGDRLVVRILDPALRASDPL